MTPLPRRTAAAALLLLAFGAPAAIARPIPGDRPAVPDEPRLQAAEESFDWDSAGIGAAAASGVVLVAGGLAAARRTRTQLAP